MEFFESKAPEQAILKPSLYQRYVYNTLVIWPHGKETVEEFVAHFNSFYASIQFNVEVEKKKAAAIFGHNAQMVRR